MAIGSSKLCMCPPAVSSWLITLRLICTVDLLALVTIVCNSISKLLWGRDFFRTACRLLASFNMSPPNVQCVCVEVLREHPPRNDANWSRQANHRWGKKLNWCLRPWYCKTVSFGYHSLWLYGDINACKIFRGITQASVHTDSEFINFIISVRLFVC